MTNHARPKILYEGSRVVFQWRLADLDVISSAEHVLPQVVHEDDDDEPRVWLVLNDVNDLLSKRGKAAAPSKAACFVLALLAGPRQQEELLGDSEERYRANLVRFGKNRATWLLWSEVIRSACAFALRLSRFPFVAVVAREVWGRFF
jgi:hypothetical protein